MNDKPINRFRTGHYVALAANHADVVEALENELLAALADREARMAQMASLSEQVAILKNLCAEQEQALLAKPAPRAPDGWDAAPKPIKTGGRKT